MKNIIDIYSKLKALLILFVLSLASCIRPAISLSEEELTKTTLCTIENNSLKVVKNAEYGELSFFTHSGDPLKENNYRIKGCLIIHQPDNIHQFKDDIEIIFKIDDKEYIIKPTSIYNLPTYRSATAYTYVGNSLILLPNVHNYTITNYRFTIDKQFIAALAKASRVIIKLEKNEILDKKNKLRGTNFVELELENKNIQVFDAFQSTCLSELSNQESSKK